MSTTEKKRGRGRPATGTTPKRYIRASDELWQQVNEAAEISGESTSEYVRRVIEQDSQRVIKKNNGG